MKMKDESPRIQRFREIERCLHNAVQFLEHHKLSMACVAESRLALAVKVPKEETLPPDPLPAPLGQTLLTGGDAILDALNSYRCKNTVDSEGNGMALLDVLSPVGDRVITRGREEVESLADYLYGELALPSTAQPAAEVCPDCHGQGGKTDAAGNWYACLNDVHAGPGDGIPMGAEHDPKPLTITQCICGHDSDCHLGKCQIIGCTCVKFQHLAVPDLVEGGGTFEVITNDRSSWDLRIVEPGGRVYDRNHVCTGKCSQYLTPDEYRHIRRAYPETPKPKDEPKPVPTCKQSLLVDPVAELCAVAKRAAFMIDEFSRNNRGWITNTQIGGRAKELLAAVEKVEKGGAR